MIKNLPKWKQAWRCLIAPRFSDKELEAIHIGLAVNDPQLIQGRITVSICQVGRMNQNARCEGANIIGYGLWKAHLHRKLVWTIEDYFHDFMARVYGQEKEGRHTADNFIAWYNNTPRSKMIKSMLPEVILEQAKRIQ